MPLYRKKPVTIEAIQFTGHNHAQILAFMGVEPDHASFSLISGEDLYISTLEGVMTASAGDYITKGVAGEFYPCKESIFLATYDAV